MTPAPSGARKLVQVTAYACPWCGGAIQLPEQRPGMLKIKTAECPHCSKDVDF